MRSAVVPPLPMLMVLAWVPVPMLMVLVTDDVPRFKVVEVVPTTGVSKVTTVTSLAVVIKR